MNRDCCGDYFSANGRDWYRCIADGRVFAPPIGIRCRGCDRIVSAAKDHGAVPVERATFALVSVVRNGELVRVELPPHEHQRTGEVFTLPEGDAHLTLPDTLSLESVAFLAEWFALVHRRILRNAAASTPRQDGADPLHELLFLVAIEGIGHLSRGGKGCVHRAIEALRPDIAAELSETGYEAAGDIIRRLYPEFEPEITLTEGDFSGDPT